MPSTDGRFKTASSDIWQHMVNNSDWDDAFLLYDHLELLDASHVRFVRFVEESAHPLVRSGNVQKSFVENVNTHLVKDGYELKPMEQISSYPVFRIIPIAEGVGGDIKNLIFGSDGPKPEIVLADALQNDIQVVKNAEYCLIYTKPILPSGLLWKDLVEWWAEQNQLDPKSIETEHKLYLRLKKSLTSEPEHFFFRSYFKLYKHRLEDRLPALIPQVYLHYDPYTFRELYGNKRLPRQRMDFLFLFSSYERIIIEIDGKQHYVDDDHRANVYKYAEMVAADRALRLANYELYRFGGYELESQNKDRIVETFFSHLLKKHHKV